MFVKTTSIHWPGESDILGKRGRGLESKRLSDRKVTVGDRKVWRPKGSVSDRLGE